MDKILLGHGSGGRLMHQLVREHFAPAFSIADLSDSAVIDIALTGLCEQGARLAFTTDSYVVSPLFFPGGNIGELAVNGTLNDLAMVGAKPLYLTAGFIIEEGFSGSELEKVLSSMSAAAKNAGVKVVAGDTKVVDRGKGDGIFINTAGIGVVHPSVNLSSKKIAPGDAVIVSGFIGSHGISVMAERNGLTFDPPVLSDTVALNGLVEAMMNCTKNLKVMRDPTRGGVATTLKELALESGVCISIDEKALPITGGVKGACELLGLDPLYVANEGILIAIVQQDSAESLLAEMKRHPLASNSAIIGRAVGPDAGKSGKVLLRTAIGGSRIIDMLQGEQLPRIC